MARRILTLTSFLLRQLIFSLSGIIYILLALVFWRLFFDPGQSTPEFTYYILVIGIFGAIGSFLITFSIGARANFAFNYPMLVRLPSRIEHLVASLSAGVIFSLTLQTLVALLAMFNGPSFSAGNLLEIPPVWLAVDLFAAVLALHATDLVTSGWSRVYVYGLLAILLFGRQLHTPLLAWVSDRLFSAGAWFMGEGYISPGNMVTALGDWMLSEGVVLVGRLFDVVFWPFRAMVTAVINGYFTPTQALAPALVILYATVLFALAAQFFATKDIFFVE